jgi:hypothetical protein
MPRSPLTYSRAYAPTGHPVRPASAGVRDGDGFVNCLCAVFRAVDPTTGTPRAPTSGSDHRTSLRAGVVGCEEVVGRPACSPRDAFLRPISWSFDTGWRTRMLSDSSGVASTPTESPICMVGPGWCAPSRITRWRTDWLRPRSGRRARRKYGSPGAEVRVLADWLTTAPHPRPSRRLVVPRRRYDDGRACRGRGHAVAVRPRSGRGGRCGRARTVRRVDAKLVAKLFS